MTNRVPKSVVEQFYAAFAARDPGRIAPLLADDVVWTLSGPVDVLTFCGTRHGKAEVIDFFTRQVPDVFDVTGFVRYQTLIDGSQVATLCRISGTLRNSGRKISYRVAQFLHFRNGKIEEFRALIDSFDAVEQVLGRELSIAPAAAAERAERELVAV
jgi:ketosteroid isomerase-like protein